MNTKRLFWLLLLAAPLTLNAQSSDFASVYLDDESDENNDQRIHLYVQEVALYPGCNQAQMFTMEKQFCSHEKIKTFIDENLQYPASAKAAGLSGKVKLRAIVEKNGKISGARIMESDDPAFEEEAIRLVKSMPVFTPGKLKDEIVRSFKEMTITFNLPK